MSHTVAQSASRRDADNELYDFGCNLLDAAAEICRAAANPEAAPAVPALLGCVEAALYELSCASAALQQANAQRPELRGDARSRAIAARLERGYTNLSVALEDARAAARAARSLAARGRSAGHPGS
jgi:hypothetical protein